MKNDELARTAIEHYTKTSKVIDECVEQNNRNLITGLLLAGYSGNELSELYIETVVKTKKESMDGDADKNLMHTIADLLIEGA